MTKFIRRGKYESEDQLPVREHPEGYVAFKEPKTMKSLAVIANTIAVVITIITLAIYFIVGTRNSSFDSLWFLKFYGGLLLSLVVMVPHEFIHGIFLPGEVHYFTNLKKGMLFVVSVDDMSKPGFIWMSMAPNLLFGFIPFILFLIFPNLTLLGAFGALGIGAGAGDYMNVFNCIFQVPSKAKVYMSGLHSYWYLKK